MPELYSLPNRWARWLQGAARFDNPGGLLSKRGRNEGVDCMILRVFLVLAMVLAQVPAAAQTVPGQGSAASADAVPTDTTQADQTSADRLIELLKDDAARQELIRQLEAARQMLENQDAAAADTATPAPEEEPQTLGRRVSLVVNTAADSAYDRALELWRELERVPARLRDAARIADIDLIRNALTALGFVIVTTYAAFLLFRMLSRRISRKLSNAAKGARWLKRTLLSLTSSGLDAIIVWLSVIVALTLSVLFYGSEEQVSGPIQLNYLTAFLTVELSKVAARAVLAPRFEQLRLIPLGSAAARSIWRWLSVCIGVLGYGQLLVVPIVQREAGYLPAFALTSILGAVVVLFTLFWILRNRRAVSRWLHHEEGDARHNRVVEALADYWHVPVVLYLVGLFFIVLVRPGNVLLPLLIASAKVVALIVAWLFLRRALMSFARRGVRLPPMTKEMLPALERRLNRILPKLILVVRVVIALGVLGGVLDAIGVVDLWDWWIGKDGAGIGPESLTILGIIIVAVAIWLAVASWVDYRLNPLGRRVPTSRETTLLTLLYNATTVALIVISTMFILSEIGINIAPLIASAGVLGLAIGFGAQKLVQDIINGIFIQFENAINVGDVITVGGTTGAVEKLTVRSVSLRDVEGVFHIIPFSSVDMVSNFTRDFSFFVCDMGVAYREDMENAKQAMMDAFEELRQDPEQAAVILGDMEWFGLNSFGDSAIVLRSRIKTLPGKQWGVGRAYNLILKRLFDERGIEIPYPHMTLYWGEDRSGNAPPLRISGPRDVAKALRQPAREPAKPTQDEPPGDDDGDD